MLNLTDESVRNIVESIHDGLYLVDRHRKITYWNNGAERISGFSASEVVGRSCADNILSHMDEAGNCLCLDLCPLAATMQDQREREAKVYLHHKAGHRVPVAVRTTPLKDSAGNIVGGIEIFNEIASLKSIEERVKELEKLAYLDRLTQLPNRTFLDLELEKAHQELMHLKIPFGVLFIDIDHFKKFNDTYGHDVGDQVLVYVARNLSSNSRLFDIYGRWGGEEFIGIIRNVNDVQLKANAERVRLLIANSFITQASQKLSVTISVGATIARLEDSVETLMKRADQLLYASKLSGRNCVCTDISY